MGWLLSFCPLSPCRWPSGRPRNRGFYVQCLPPVLFLVLSDSWLWALPWRRLHRDVSQAEHFGSSGSILTQRGFFSFIIHSRWPPGWTCRRGASVLPVTTRSTQWKGMLALSPSQHLCGTMHRTFLTPACPLTDCSLICLPSYHIFRVALNAVQIQTWGCFSPGVSPPDCTLRLSWVNTMSHLPGLQDPNTHPTPGLDFYDFTPLPARPAQGAVYIVSNVIIVLFNRKLKYSGIVLITLKKCIT